MADLMNVEWVKHLLRPIWRRLPESLRARIRDAGPTPFARNAFFHVMSPFDTSARDGDRVRINMILPSVLKEHLTGGPATLVNYVLETQAKFPDYAVRLLPVMVPFSGNKSLLPEKLQRCEVTKMGGSRPQADELPGLEVVQDAAFKSGELEVSKNDVFIASMWPTHFVAKSLQSSQAEYFGRAHKIQYLIQDYEPSALYPWSDLFLQAEQTYSDTEETVAIVGTESLHQYLVEQGHDYKTSYWFEPGRNALSKPVPLDQEKSEILVIYGRPEAPRNCFPILLEALLKLTGEHPSIASRFQFISVGTQHPDYRLNNGAVLRSKGFLPPDEYMDLMSSASVGCFLVVSPHTGYVALEMARLGIITVSNSFRTKKIGDLHPNIREVKTMSIDSLTNALLDAVRESWTSPGAALGVARTVQENAPPPQEVFGFIEDLYKTHYKFGNDAE